MMVHKIHLQMILSVICTVLLYGASYGFETRNRRDVDSSNLVFVVRRTSVGELFTVALDASDPSQQFDLVDPVPSGMAIDATTGMVSVASGFQWNNTALSLSVNRTTSTNQGGSIISVTVYIVSRGDFDPIFTENLLPLWTTCPVWIRPGTVIYRVESVDSHNYRANVRYRLESGGDGKFGVNATTGEIFIVGRQMFVDQTTYSLAVSAQAVGAANGSATPTQLVNVQVGYRPPQVLLIPYNVSLYENTTAASVFHTVRAKSFQNLSLEYRWSTNDDNSNRLFTLDQQTGAITLNRALTFAVDPHQYFFNLTVTEQYSNYATVTLLIINLTPVNHQPYFPVSHYVVNDFLETSTTGTPVVNVWAVDLDPWELGRLTYTVSNSLFAYQPVTGNIVVNRQLDYDTITNHMYEFYVTATDGGSPPLSASATVQVWMKNTNDKAPVFEPYNQTTYLKKGVSSGSLVYIVQAYDPDGDNIVFGLGNVIDSQASNYLQLDPATGQITLKQSISSTLDIASLMLNVTATDNGSCCDPAYSTPYHTSWSSVSVRIIGVNTQPSFPECHSYHPSVAEGSPIGTDILNMTAVDVDSADSGQLSFQIVNTRSTPDVFGIRINSNNPKMAVLYAAQPLDQATLGTQILKYNGSSMIPVTVKVQDRGVPPLSTNCFLFVRLNDVNNHAPQFDYRNEFYKTVTLTRNATSSRIYRVYAYDLDTGNNAKVSYTLTGVQPPCGGCFVIALDSGWITYGVSQITAGMYSLNVTATDGGNPALSSYAVVTITVTDDANQQVPVWQPINGVPIDDYSGLYLPENTPYNTPITGWNILRLFANSNVGTIAYHLTSDDGPPMMDGDGAFVKQSPVAINGSMVIVTRKIFDASAVPFYVLRCRAYIGAGDQIASVARLIVRIGDVNDQSPMFQGMDINGEYPAAVSEYTVRGDTIIYVTAIDMDRDAPNNVVTYFFAPDCPDCSAFTINESTGEIKSNFSQQFDTNDHSEYVLKVFARDGAPSSLPGVNGPNDSPVTVVRVRVIGGQINAPRFNSTSYTYSLSEGLPRFTQIDNVTAAIDPNDPVPVQYSIQAGNDRHVFAVDVSAGTIYTVGDLLYAKKQSYSLTLRVWDGYYANIANIIISLISANLYPPVFSLQKYLNSNFVEKSSGVGGQQILTVSAVDRDQSANKTRPGTISYRLELPSSSSSSSNSVPHSLDVYQSVMTNMLSIDATTGLISFRTGPSQTPSRDLPWGFNEWLVNVIATDESGQATAKSGYTVVSIQLRDINDHAPLFDSCCLNGTVKEGSPSPGTLVLRLYAFDPDAGVNGSVTFSSTSLPSLFQVSPNGTITTVGGPAFSRRTQSTYYLTVRASDAGTPPQTATQQVVVTVVDANNFPPVFPGSKSYTVSVPEQLPKGSSVFVAMAVDADDDIPNNARLTYSISGIDAQYFFVDSIYTTGAGVIRVKQPIAFSSSKPTYTLNVRVSDNDPAHFDTATVTITIYDINDHAPVFRSPSMSVNISRWAQPESSVIRLSATDADSGINSNFSYYVDYANTDRKFNFKIDPQTGEVKIRNQLDVNINRSFDLRILAVDRGDPQMTGTATLHINIVDPNDNPPSIQFLPQYPLVVRANTQQGSEAFCFSATQPGTTNNPPFNFTYICNSANCMDFSLRLRQGNSNQACLIAQRSSYTRAVLGFKSYTLKVNISDNSSPPQWGVSEFTLIVESTNDHPPSSGDKRIVVNTFSGMFTNIPYVTIGNVYVNDTDDWDLPDETFSVDSKWDSSFGLDAKTGQLRMYPNASRGDHQLAVSVYDSKWRATVRCTVTVSVHYLNDSAITSSASIRISGDASDLMDASSSESKLDKLRKKLASLLGTSADNVDILSVRNADDTPGKVDVTFTAHGSPYYSSEKLNAIVAMNMNEIYQATGVQIDSAPVDLCRQEYVDCWSGGCTTKMVVNDGPQIANSNSSSFVGVNITYVRVCGACGSPSDGPWASNQCAADSCLNGGICNQNWNGYNCTCPFGFEGPRCQQTKVRFTQNDGYVFLKSVESCQSDKLSFEFMTLTSSNQLILFVGPVSNSDTTKDFLSVELISGFPRLRVNLGDGEVALPAGAPSLPNLADGNWHSVEIFRSGRDVRLIVDHCSNAVVTEDIANSSEIRTRCDFQATTPGEKFLLSVSSPLQLGGRRFSDMAYPSGLTRTGFVGCIKNVVHNGELFDLHLGSSRISQSAEDGCTSENCNSCPGNSTCVGSMNGQPKCPCYPGLRGDHCDQFTMVKELTAAGSYAEWFPQSGYNAVNLTSQKDVKLQVKFRTRQPNGIIFFAASFSKLEHAILEIVDSHLQFRYDLGNDDRIVSLPAVNVSDGISHVAHVERHGNQVILQLDSGEGRFYAERWPADEHRLLRIAGASGGGEVSHNVWSRAVTVDNNLIKACIQDVRYADTLFPLDANEQGSSPIRVESRSLGDNCPSGACGNVAACPLGQFCYDMWRSYECRCTDPAYYVKPGSSVCAPRPDCSVNPCVNGYCIVVNSAFKCVCDDGFNPPYCNDSSTPPVTERTSDGDGFNRTAAIAAPVVIGSVILIIILILIILCLLARRGKDSMLYEPDDDMRENIVCYDEEGAGEEDMHAYDLSRLRKPVDPDLNSLDAEPVKVPGLTLGARAMQANRGQPKDYPEVGDYIADRLQDVDNELPPNNDSLHGFDFEGAGSEGASLSSIESGSSSSNADQDYGFLNNWGPPFRKLADLYGNDDNEDDVQDVSNV